jgi:hypothetical protein
MRRFGNHSFLAGVAILLGALVARAYDTSWVTAGQTVSAAKLKADLDEAQARIAALESFQQRATGNGTYSLGAVYCGSTAPVTGSIGGYAGGKALCAAAAVCNSATAHMCSGEEVIRSLATGIALPVPPQGFSWYASGVWAQAANGHPVDDCLAFTATDNHVGQAWTGTTNNGGCTASYPILCCD